MLISLENIAPSPIPQSHLESSEIWNSTLTFESKSSILISADSGKGKSTLLHLIYGLRKDYSGNLFIDSGNAEELGFQQWENLRRESLSMVFQDLRLFSQLSARENIELIPQFNPNSPSISEMSERLGMIDFLEQPALTLSHGQRQRIALMRALRKPFKWLLLDEPFSHLDKNNQELACDLIKEVTEYNEAGIILSSLGATPSIMFEKNFIL
ncbi:ATP-binding cassette domain-containing protein [Opitutales bacterium]|nr:ATP-binding cassette domain-containing protein [Opitutales bacterium]MDA8990141.1 ATP-binding cassette domain-containing protein [Opitutales bacterium]